MGIRGRLRVNKFEKADKILLLVNIVLIGFVIAVIFNYFSAFYINQPYPMNTFLFTPVKKFRDFMGLLDVIRNFAPFGTSNIWVNYFPLAYVLLLPFLLIGNKLIAYLIFASVFLAFLIYMNVKVFACENLTKSENFRNIFILTFLAYPVLFALDRGNFDMILLILFAGFVYAFKSEKYLRSAIFLAVINAIKPFTLLFLFLFLFKKKFKEFAISIITSLVLIVGCFFVFKGNVLEQMSTLANNLAGFLAPYVFENKYNLGMVSGSSLFMALKLLLTRFHSPFTIPTDLLIRLYSYLNLIITSATLFFTFKEKIFWKQISLLTLYMLTMPYLVYDYKLVFLFVPLWLFVNSKEKSGFDKVYTVLFGLLLISKSIIIFTPGFFPDAFYSTSIIINPLIMLVFMGLIIIEQFKTKKKEIESE